MTARLTQRQCTLCGRQGTRYFTNLGLAYVCTYTRACSTRRDRLNVRKRPKGGTRANANH